MSNYKQIAEKVREKAIACGRSPSEIALVAVSKGCQVESIQTAYQEGCRDFGENRLKEALEKKDFLPSDCKWHFIGNLQKNKVAKTISAFHLIHSVGDLSLAREISQKGQIQGITPSILLQVNTSGEKTKQGLSSEGWERCLEDLNQLPNLHIIGLMTMAPYTREETVIRSCFRSLYLLREKWRDHMQNPSLFQHLSMGMSNDYFIAIEEGATFLRIGSAIFLE